MSRKGDSSVGQTLLGLCILALIAALGLWAISSVVGALSKWIGAAIQTISTLDAAIIVALITGCVSIFTVVFGAILKEYLAYRFKKLEFLRNRREIPYRKLIEINFKMVQKSQRGEEYTSKEMFDDFYEFGQELTLWGSTKAIKLWDEWRLAPHKGNTDGTELLLLMEKSLFQLRRDMGQKGGLAKGDILKLYINDFDEAIRKK